MAQGRSTPHRLWDHFPEAACKIKSLEEAAKISDGVRAAGKTVVTLNGSFDVLHVGHLNIIREAKQQGDVLIIGLNSDASFRKYKDSRGPIVPESQRAALLAAILYVDYIVLFDEPDPIAFLEKILPAVHCNGGQYGEDCMEASTVTAHGGVVHCVSELADGGCKISTSGLLSRIGSRLAASETKAVLLDRDGVINEEREFVYRKEDFQFREGAIDLLQHLTRHGYSLIVITNQSGIARGLYTEEDAQALHQYMTSELERHGVRIAAIYMCPHHPEGTVPEYSRVCDCRKPHSMLFQRARKEHHINVAASWAVGDRLRDCEAAKREGFRTVLVSSQLTGAEDAESPWVDHSVSCLSQVQEIIAE